MLSRLVLTAILASGVALAGDDPFDKPPKKAEPEKNEPKGLAALVRFHHKTTGERLYAAGDDQAAAFRAKPDLIEEAAVGHVLSAEQPKTRRLWHSTDPKGRHYFYLQAKPNGPRLTVQEEFTAYVWTEKAPGLVPVFGSVLDDGSDLYLDLDPKKVRKVAEDAFTSQGTKRTQLSPAFYVYDRSAKTPGKKK